MTQEERDILKTQILNEINVLLRSIRTLTGLMDTEEVQSDANDWFTTKESNTSKEINEMALEKAKRKMVELRKVFSRIDSPDYGICVKCRKPIPFERLKAMPTATRCLSCG
jgi:DnaK suppressor protein